MNTDLLNPTPLDDSCDTTMPPPIPDLTLIVAATPQMGIGRAGTLPWPALKTDMSYFARVTKRVPSLPSPPSPHPPRGQRRNAVIMGRKTWESIPPRFRPLRDRINVVLTRGTGAELIGAGEGAGGECAGGEDEVVVTASGLDGSGGALEKLRERRDVGRVFVIGGSSVYKAALELEQTKRILLTRIGKEFECDTFFPINPSGEAEAAGGSWRRAGREELEGFVGEEVGDGKKVDGDVELEFCLFLRP